MNELAKGTKSSALGQLVLSAWALPLLCVAMLGIHLQTLGNPPLAGTEGHRVITAHQMIESGEYLIPKLYGLPYLYKPPLYYWLLAGFEGVFGANTWAWRLPSALCLVATLAVCFWFGRRWFGREGGVVAGFAFMLLICLWQDARSADIDPLNILLSTVTACALLELLVREPKGKWGWILLGTVFLGLALLAKVVGMIPAVLVPLVGVVCVRRERFRALLRWELGVVVLGAVAIFLMWAVPMSMAKVAVATQMDNDGVKEGVRKLFPSSLGDLMAAVVIPPTLFAYALPVAVGMVFAFHPKIKAGRYERGSREQLVLAITFGIIAAWVACMIATIDTERYAYVTMPLVALVAAGVFVRLYRESGGPELTNVLFLATSIALMVAIGVVTFLVRKAAVPKLPIPVACYVAAGIGVLLALRAIWAAGRGKVAEPGVLLVGVMLMLAVPFAEYSDRRRDARSGIHAARALAKLIPEGTEVTTADLLYYQPELFWYLSRPVKALGKRGLDAGDVQALPAGTYLLEPEEYQRFKHLPQDHAKVTAFISNKKKCYLVELQPPAATRPVSTPATQP